jgi:hypothetical protein
MSIRSAGWAAIASGIIGLLAFGCLVSFLVVRNQSFQTAMFIVRFHDLGVIIQFLLLIPAAFALHKLSHGQVSGMSQTMLTVIVGSLLFTTLFLLLGMFKIMEDVVYMFPQGIFGGCLIIICWRMKGILSKALRLFGILVGLGLALVGTFPPGFAIFVDPGILRVPTLKLPDEEMIRLGTKPANQILHQILYIGTFGVATLPIWTILLGWTLLRNRNSISTTSAPILA